MSNMLTEVYDAFRYAGVSDEKARSAATARSSTEPRFDALDRKIDKLEAKIDLRFAEADCKIDTRFAKVEGDISLLRWMMTFTLATVVTILFLLLKRWTP
jgi:hypothetical protein